MLISLAIALIFTPWMCRKLFAAEKHDAAAEAHTEGKLHRFFVRLMTPLSGWSPMPASGAIDSISAPPAAIVVAVLLAVFQLVVLKMLPFDNKSEFQVVVNMPEGTAGRRHGASACRIGQHRAAGSGSHRFSSLCGNGGPDQFQWPGAPVLPARRGQPGRPAGESRRQSQPQPQEPRDRAGDSARARGAKESGSAPPRCKSLKYRRDLRSRRRSWRKFTARATPAKRRSDVHCERCSTRPRTSSTPMTP